MRTPSYIPMGTPELNQAISTQQQLTQTLDRSVPRAWHEAVSFDFFVARNNNFPLRFFPKETRAIYGETLPELEALLATPRGQTLQKMMMYQYLTRGVDFVNFFLGDAEYTPVRKGMRKVILETNRKLMKYGIPSSPTVPTQEFLSSFIKQQAPDLLVDDQGVLLPPVDPKHAFPKLASAVASYFGRLPDADTLPLQHMLWQELVATHLADPVVQAETADFTLPQQQEYLFCRYFQ